MAFAAAPSQTQALPEFMGAVASLHHGARWSLQQIPSNPAFSASTACCNRSSGAKRSCASAAKYRTSSGCRFRAQRTPLTDETTDIGPELPHAAARETADYREASAIRAAASTARTYRSTAAGDAAPAGSSAANAVVPGSSWFCQSIALPASAGNG